MINKKSCFYFLDELSLASAQLAPLSRLKIKTHLFVDQQLTQKGALNIQQVFLNLQDIEFLYEHNINQIE